MKEKTTYQIAKEVGCGVTTVKRRLSIFNIPRRGLVRKIYYCIDCGKEISRGSKRCEVCFGKNMLGKNNPNYKDGRTLKNYYCMESNCNNIVSELNRRCRSCSKKGELHNFFGKKRPEISKKMKLNNPMGKLETRLKMSKTRIERKCGYVNGKGYEPYSKEFTSKLKENIRQRDNYECQGKDCNITQEEHLLIYGRGIEIHHINYNKQNCDKYNLITLCKQCNIRANYNRKNWQNYFTEKMHERIML